MAFGKKNKPAEPVTAYDVEKLGHKHEVDAAKDKKSSVYDHFHAQESAKQVADAKKRKKRYGIILGSLLAILLVIYIISMLTTQWGDLVITIGDMGNDGKSLLLCENVDFKDGTGTVKLDGGSVKKVTNITKAWLPDNLDTDKGGSHNGDNYLAYTFFLRNTGDEDLKYNTDFEITGASKSADEAIRIEIFRNGEDATYAKGTYRDRKTSETDATKFVTESKVIETKNTSLKAGATDRFTVVMWIEGNDAECVDAIRGGFVRSTMTFNVVDESAEADS